MVDAYLEFLAARCRPNTVLAAGFDLKVFFTTVPKEPVEVAATCTAEVLVAPTAGVATGGELRWSVTSDVIVDHSVSRTDEAIIGLEIVPVSAAAMGLPGWVPAAQTAA